MERIGSIMYEQFTAAFPPDNTAANLVDAVKLSDAVFGEFGVAPPPEIVTFWKALGSGYFGGKVLYFFGDAEIGGARDSLVAWNKKNFWRQVFPSPKEGGPFFFAETCFGDQLGFRFADQGVFYTLFCVDTFESFVIASSGAELFETVLTNRYVLLDERRLEMVQKRLGPLRTGMHYAPLISPLAGGAETPENYVFETPNVHFRTSIATFFALRGAGQQGGPA
jgi:hypothetical protein